MTSPLFIQIHTLTSYPASLLNRDDVGFAKRIGFGGVTRTRISSQCLKRHWRRFDGEHSLALLLDQDAAIDLAVRSRLSFDRYVKEPLVSEGLDPALAAAATEAVMVEVLGESAKAKKAKEAKEKDDQPEAPKAGKKRAGKTAEAGPSIQTGQVTVLGRQELEFFLQEARAIAKAAEAATGVAEAAKAHFTKEWGKNLAGLKRAAGLDGALFGRMVTSDKLARSDASVHVAHAFTVHGENAETDYFSAVDDLVATDEGMGSGHIGTAELTSGLFYNYVVVDVGQLVSNLEGCQTEEWQGASRDLAARVVESLVQLVCRVSPGAKRGSTAPYAYASLVLVEIGTSQPRTLANAFLAPVSQGKDVLGSAVNALARYVVNVDAMYELTSDRYVAAVGDFEGALKELGANAKNVAGVAAAAGKAVRGGA